MQDPEPAAASEPESAAAPETGSDPAVAPEAGSDSEVAPETGSDPAVAPEAGSDSEVAPETGSDPAVAPETGSDPAPEVEVAHGVGPWPGGPAEWPSDERFDPELLAHGDRRNVVDRYRYWRMEAIVEDLDARRHAFHVAIENWQHDMNIGSIVRSANAFLAERVHIIGRRRWNRRGAMVTDRYQHVMHHETVSDFAAWAAAERIPIIAVDNLDGAVPVDRAELPERCVLLFGAEGPGLSEEALAAASGHVEITQYGSTRSINAGAAAAVIMYEWCRQHAG